MGRWGAPDHPPAVSPSTADEVGWPAAGFMNILGISYGFGDPSACLLVDGRVVIAISEGQLRRDLGAETFPELAVARCLEEAGLRPGDVDRVAVAMRPSHWSERLRYALSRPRWASTSIRAQVRGTQRRGDALLRWLGRNYRPFRWPQLDFIDPVRALAEGSFFASGMTEAAILCLHGGVEWNTDYLGHAGPGGFRVYHQSSFPHSFGLFVESIAAFCGFSAAGGHGRVAGLALSGDASLHYDVLSDVVDVDRAGRVTLDVSFFSREALADPRRRVAMPYGHKLAQTFGRPRAAGGPVLPHHADVAAAAQRVLEERVLAVAEALHQRSGASRLIFSGDLARNAMLNTRLLRASSFEEIFVAPAPGRKGQAIAAAVALAGRPTAGAASLFLGPRYDEGRQRRAVEAGGLTAQCDDVVAHAARLLAEGKAIGWFDGAAEHGPVPLGHRSIYCAPRAGAGHARLRRAKSRVAPIPPVVALPVSAASDYISLPRPSPHGELVAEVRPEHREALGDLVRVQTVTSDTTPRLALLLDAVGQRTGMPVLLQTSFNRTGEPPVESPEEAVACYRELVLDALVLGDNLVTAPVS